ncbi:FixH family protein [Paenibacillus sp. FSL W8-0919]|uniref:FixH family protein n=1 Tax=Paenibacillus sp. FSL W8-0919 TaxID=2954707 RepID=UPI0030F4F8B4
MKARWIILLLFGFMLLFILFRLVEDHPSTEALYIDDQIRMQITPVDSSAVSMQETTFELQIDELSGIPVTGADFDLNITMPDMFCGVFPASIEEIQPGVYHATVVPVMRGKWQAEAELQWKERYVKVSTVFKVH